MDYIRLIDISNQYPNLPSYVRNGEKSATLFGLYKETNKLDFILPSLQNINPIDDLQLRFIVGIRNNDKDIDVKYYTSQQFYSDMEASNIEGNPYFLTQATNLNFIILVDLEKFISTFENLKKIELEQGVNMLLNNFLNTTENPKEKINYKLLMKFLDWVITEPKLSELDTDGVIPADTLAQWEVGDYDPIMMKWSFNKDKDAKSKEENTSQPIIKPTIEKWRLRRKRDLDRNGMGIYPTINVKNFNIAKKNKADKQMGIIKEGDTFFGYKVKTTDKGFVIWALQDEGTTTPKGYAYQGRGDTVEPA